MDLYESDDMYSEDSDHENNDIKNCLLNKKEKKYESDESTTYRGSYSSSESVNAINQKISFGNEVSDKYPVHSNHQIGGSSSSTDNNNINNNNNNNNNNNTDYQKYEEKDQYRSEENREMYSNGTSSTLSDCQLYDTKIVKDLSHDVHASPHSSRVNHEKGFLHQNGINSYAPPEVQESSYQDGYVSTSHLLSDEPFGISPRYTGGSSTETLQPLNDDNDNNFTVGGFIEVSTMEDHSQYYQTPPRNPYPPETQFYNAPPIDPIIPFPQEETPPVTPRLNNRRSRLTAPTIASQKGNSIDSSARKRSSSREKIRRSRNDLVIQGQAHGPRPKIEPPIKKSSTTPALFDLLDDNVLFNIATFCDVSTLGKFQTLCKSSRHVVLVHDKSLWPYLQIKLFGPEETYRLNQWAQRAELTERQTLVYWKCRNQWWQDALLEEHLALGIRGMSIDIAVKDGKTSLLLGGADGNLGFFRGEEGTTRTSPLPVPGPQTLFRSIQVHAKNLAVSSVKHINDWMITTGTDGLLRFWHNDNEMEQMIFPYGINGFALSDDINPWGCVTLEDGSIFIWDLAQRDLAQVELAHRVEIHKSSAYACVWKDQNTVFTGGMDRRIYLSDRRHKRIVHTWNSSAHVFDLLSEDHNLYAAQSNTIVGVWDIRMTGYKNKGGGTVKQVPCDATFECRGHRGSVEALTFCTGGFASVGADGELRIWDKNDGRPLAAFATKNKTPLTTVTSYSDSIWCAGPNTEILHYRLPSMPQKELWAEELNLLRKSKDKSTALKEWNINEFERIPPEGIGRHSNLRRSLSKGRTVRNVVENVRRSIPTGPGGAFDRSRIEKRISIGATGLRHRDLLASAYNK